MEDAIWGCAYTFLRVVTDGGKRGMVGGPDGEPRGGALDGCRVQGRRLDGGSRGGAADAWGVRGGVLNGESRGRSLGWGVPSPGL